MAFLRTCLFLTFVCTCIYGRLNPENLAGDQLVDYVNSLKTTWTATKNSNFKEFSKEVKFGMMGVNYIHHSIEDKKHLSPTRLLDLEIPSFFDSRVQWPECPSLHAIRDQSACGSCWSFGAVEAMEDRICIATGGKVQVTLSADDMLSCCTGCGDGCHGGWPMLAWQFWVSNGIVSGGSYTTQSGCRPYPFPPCGHPINQTHYESLTCIRHYLYSTPKCEQKCQSSYTQNSYGDDKHYGKTAYAVEFNVESIQKEIMTNGPVEVAFEVYDDFMHYKGGIYQHKGGLLDGGHAVKMLGWGEENGVPYWIVANSWNRYWGENGFFRIIRGVNECGIEAGVVAGLPKV